MTSRGRTNAAGSWSGEFEDSGWRCWRSNANRSLQHVVPDLELQPDARLCFIQPQRRARSPVGGAVSLTRTALWRIRPSRPTRSVPTQDLTELVSAQSVSAAVCGFLMRLKSIDDTAEALADLIFKRAYRAHFPSIFMFPLCTLTVGRSRNKDLENESREPFNGVETAVTWSGKGHLLLAALLPTSTIAARPPKAARPQPANYCPT